MQCGTSHPIVPRGAASDGPIPMGERPYLEPPSSGASSLLQPAPLHTWQPAHIRPLNTNPEPLPCASGVTSAHELSAGIAHSLAGRWTRAPLAPPSAYTRRTVPNRVGRCAACHPRTDGSVTAPSESLWGGAPPRGRYAGHRQLLSPAMRAARGASSHRWASSPCRSSHASNPRAQPGL